MYIYLWLYVAWLFSLVVLRLSKVIKCYRLKSKKKPVRNQSLMGYIDLRVYKFGFESFSVCFSNVLARYYMYSFQNHYFDKSIVFAKLIYIFVCWGVFLTSTYSLLEIYNIIWNKRYFCVCLIFELFLSHFIQKIRIINQPSFRTFFKKNKLS